MPLVPAKCPECGGLVEVDNEKRAGLCQHCGQPFVVEDAIQTFNTYYQTTNNYNVNSNVDNSSVHNYSDGTVVNVYEDNNKDFVIEAGILKEYHGESTEIVIPDNVLELSKDCFSDLPITSITIPSSVTEIGYQSWQNLTKLSKIIVDEENYQFQTIDGVLFNKITNELLVFPPVLVNEKMNYVVPNNFHKLSTIAKEQASHFNSFVCEGVDYLHLSCTDEKNITFANENGLPYKFTYHNYKEGKCIDCGAYNIIASKSYTLDSSEVSNICVCCLSDNVVVLSEYYSCQKKSSYGYLDDPKEDDRYLDLIKSDLDIYSYIKNAKKLYISNEFCNDSELDYRFSCNSPNVITLFDSLEELYVETDCWIVTELQGLTNLSRVCIKDRCTISKEVFYNCASIEEISMDKFSGVVPESAFENCTSLRKITLGSECRGIGNYAFKNCINLNEINIIFNNNFWNYSFDAELYTELRNLTKIVIKVLPDYSIEKLKSFFEYDRMGGRFRSLFKYSNNEVIIENVPDEVKWELLDKCKYCGGELKIRLFKRNICRSCGKEQ